jgi:hypothetical protein
VDVVDTVVEALILDLLGFVSERDRSYEEVMDAWRTSCPKLPVWEDANDRGLVTRVEVNGNSTVRVTPVGRSLLEHRKISRCESVDPELLGRQRMLWIPDSR